MRVGVPDFLTTTLMPALRDGELYAKRYDNGYARCTVVAVGWLIAAFVPIVAFDAGGGQSSFEVLWYVFFRGMDRDLWYATSPLSMLFGTLSAFALLLGFVLHSIGIVFKDVRLIWGGSGTISVSLLIVILATVPVAAITMLGIVAIPHVGWWLALVYTLLTLRLVAWWSDGNNSHLSVESTRTRRTFSRRQTR